MSTERSLAALLRSLQAISDLQDAFGLLPTAASFLSLLTNPLNVSLLASQLLIAPAIWDHHVDLQVCRRVLGVFNTAAMTVMRNDEVDEPKPKAPYGRPKRIERDAWVKAVVNGADEKSPRWRHMLLIGGVLIGFEGQNRQGLPLRIRNKLESALVKATQLALDDLSSVDGIDAHCITMILNYTFDLLPDSEKSKLDYDRLLPVIVRATFFSREGLEGGYFLGAIDEDIIEYPGKRFGWPLQSASYDRIMAISSSPLVSSLGPLSRLIAHTIDKAQNPVLVSQSMDVLADFARTMTVQWRQNKLSEVDVSEEKELLDPESLKKTIPALWKVLRNSFYSVVIVLRAVLGRVINDPVLAADRRAPFLSMKAIHILRNLYFVSSRIGPNSSSQYTFALLAAIDILTQYPDLVESFLKSIKPAELGQIPEHPLERCLDLFYLNTAEHFSLVLSPESNEELLISAATPYLSSGASRNLLEIFEAAHSVVLAVFAVPANAKITAKYLPFYVDTLFTVFPENLSARQFRLAFKTVLQVTAPPSPLANSQPLLPSILLQVLYDRAMNAPTTPLPSNPQDSTDASNPSPPLSEQTVLTLALIDSLHFLRVGDLEEWLPMTARLVNMIHDAKMRGICTDRFWEALSSGEMDVEQAHYCVTWWSTKGGREMVLFGYDQGVVAEFGNQDGPYMSGAIGGVARENKL